MDLVDKEIHEESTSNALQLELSDSDNRVPDASVPSMEDVSYRFYVRQQVINFSKKQCNF